MKLAVRLDPEKALEEERSKNRKHQRKHRDEKRSVEDVADEPDVSDGIAAS
jgi:hypothetical protein